MYVYRVSFLHQEEALRYEKVDLPTAAFVRSYRTAYNTRERFSAVFVA